MTRLISSVDELNYEADGLLGKSQARQIGDCTAGEHSQCRERLQ